MAEIKALPTTILLLSLISLFHSPKAASKPAGFSLKLIRSYSPISPYHRNTSFGERYKSYLHATRARASYWSSFNATANKTMQPDVMQPPLKHEHETIVVVMRIGTPAQQVFLEFDTGAYLSWTQCATCTTCFPQSTPKFDPKLSTSYREMSPDDPNCKRVYTRTENGCVYTSKFIAGQYTKGIASYDTFASIDNNPDQTAANIRFGCSLESVSFRFPPNTVMSGILAMSRDRESLPSQLIRQSGGGSEGRFSYCLPDSTRDVVNVVTFGADIPSTPGDNLATVPFIIHPFGPHAWAVNLLDVSVGEKRLNFPPETFATKPGFRGGGLVLDTGAPVTIINSDAFSVIESEIQNHLSKSEGLFTEISGDDLDLCYRYNGPAGQLPTDYLQPITFHLDEGADLVMPLSSVYLFEPEDNSFCLGIVAGERDWPNILGAMQQQDTRFVYDLYENSLYFIPELCTGDQA